MKITICTPRSVLRGARAVLPVVVGVTALIAIAGPAFANGPMAASPQAPSVSQPTFMPNPFVPMIAGHPTSWNVYNPRPPLIPGSRLMQPSYEETIRPRPVVIHYHYVPAPPVVRQHIPVGGAEGGGTFN